jgi:hypothetical protein
MRALFASPSFIFLFVGFALSDPGRGAAPACTGLINRPKAITRGKLFGLSRLTNDKHA